MLQPRPLLITHTHTHTRTHTHTHTPLSPASPSTAGRLNRITTDHTVVAGLYRKKSAVAAYELHVTTPLQLSGGPQQPRIFLNCEQARNLGVGQVFTVAQKALNRRPFYVRDAKNGFVPLTKRVFSDKEGFEGLELLLKIIV